MRAKPPQANADQATVFPPAAPSRCISPGVQVELPVFWTRSTTGRVSPGAIATGTLAVSSTRAASGGPLATGSVHAKDSPNQATPSRTIRSDRRAVPAGGAVTTNVRSWAAPGATGPHRNARASPADSAYPPQPKADQATLLSAFVPSRTASAAFQVDAPVLRTRTRSVRRSPGVKAPPTALSPSSTSASSAAAGAPQR